MLPWEGFRLERPVISQDPWTARKSTGTRDVEQKGGLRQRMLKMLRDGPGKLAVDQGEEEEAIHTFDREDYPSQCIIEELEMEAPMEVAVEDGSSVSEEGMPDLAWGTSPMKINRNGMEGKTMGHRLR